MLVHFARRAVWRAQLTGLKAAHALLILRLRVERWLAARGALRSPRVVASACWTFPIYSQTFVQTEALAMVRAGFALRFFYTEQGPRTALAHFCADLWRFRRRVLLHRVTGARDLAHFRRRMPARVDAVADLIARTARLPRHELEQHEHFLHAFSFARAVEAWGADYLHSYFFYERTLFALVAAHLLDLPRGVSCYADHQLQDYPLKLVPLHLQTCDVVVATSRRIRGELETLHGRPLDTIVVKPNAVDVASFAVRSRGPLRPAEAGVRTSRPVHRPVRLVSVNRIDPKKGLEYVISAVQVLIDRGRTVELEILGAPDPHLPECLNYLTRLEAQVREHRLEGVVRLAGQRTSREVRASLARADVFVAASVELENGNKDGIPTALLEAMAAGCVIVATRAASITEVIDHEADGLLVPARDSHALADAIERVTDDPALSARLQRGAAARARRQLDVATSEVPFHDRVRQVIDRRRQWVRA